MTWANTKTAQFNCGNEIVQLWKMVPDSATIEFDTGLGVIDHAVMGVGSVATAIRNYTINALTAATAANGYIAITGCVSGDVLFVTIYGR